MGKIAVLASRERWGLLLPVLVVGADSKMPGAGFFAYAEANDHDVRDPYRFVI
jgi:hypothetical protein